MKPGIKKRWINALLSGKYKQGKEILHRGQKFCCLGVLCDLYRKSTANTAKETWGGGTEPYSSKSFFNKYDLLPFQVINWAGLDNTPDGDVQLKKTIYLRRRINDDEKRVVRTLSGANDNGMTFKTIAKLIEKEL